MSAYGIISGSIIGNNGKQCIAEVSKMLETAKNHVFIKKFRKVANKDMFNYECIIINL